MKQLTKETYERNLRELMNTPIGGLPQKTVEKPPEVESKVINKQPVETMTTPICVNPQPQIHQIQPSSFSLQKTGNAQLSLTRLGVLVGVGGAMFGYLYSTSPTIKLQIKTMFTKLVPYLDNPIIMGSIVLGVLICSVGLVFRR